MSALASISSDLAHLVEASGPSVVRVEGRHHRPGSGIVWSSDGLVVTADHVVERDEGITVGLPDGQTVAATLVGRDPTTDLAILRVQSATVAAVLENPEGLRAGELAIALGRPGRSVRAALGIIAAFGDAWRMPGGGQIDRYIEADFQLGRGFSGGPLVDSAGKVRGLNTQVLHRRGITIPVPTLRRVVDAIVAHGYIRRAYLGVGAQPVPIAANLRAELGQDTGLLVLSLAPGGPAERGGVLQGDIIVTVEGTPVRRLHDLMAGLGGERVGATIRIRLIRAGQLHELNLVAGERKAS